MKNFLKRQQINLLCEEFIVEYYGAGMLWGYGKEKAGLNVDGLVSWFGWVLF